MRKLLTLGGVLLALSTAQAQQPGTVVSVRVVKIDGTPVAPDSALALAWAAKLAPPPLVYAPATIAPYTRSQTPFPAFAFPPAPQPVPMWAVPPCANGRCHR